MFIIAYPFHNIIIGKISSFLYYSSQSHFQKAFKNHYGITPELYRKSAK
ncbi:MULTISPECIES: AraC family transcriptional regulator [Clostridium]|uniref:AraC family transcriptional regulator n=2 Tax=Clostridium TaxID=1485 RepID=A0AAW3W3E0_CLOBE|nr:MULTISPECIES: AraC family transcriptional regulator [Clostridium]AQS18356.2 AraC family transcriptional regulator [Clostridium beijerinckii NRRL B-598]MBC2458483.1 AraC family transcriptional regulator [Clostridium beijerinckii]MBC2473405.1 AraC family transcriptional regulator [Clostridium beijerinckii]MDG5853158.1 AraC family transcriptional regulator [Clostridium beijerinckii]QES73898.1 AraC family transcriptional regulator [Clostridium diolis]